MVWSRLEQTYLLEDVRERLLVGLDRTTRIGIALLGALLEQLLQVRRLLLGWRSRYVSRMLLAHLALVHRG